ncbi:hypothetical protein DOTSEDRAFT_181617 [Dothistroma septosporum NZE10]|uniref:Cytochrome P450 n=1 Tax=Dothistroma septosporum (strain NZE10 / CBS 128990) TaxID=675120 RepID=N1PBU5_DOTSN|nr:hypothetical protein DOTSEDRAFT_181617 [Dothistroma septosporum NZE10]
MSEFIVSRCLVTDVSNLQLIGEAALLIAVLGALSIIYHILIIPLISPLRDLPTPAQEPLIKRLFREPNGNDFLRWIEEVPNSGLIRYFGFLNTERVLLATTEAARTIHEGDTKIYFRPKSAKAFLCRLTGGGLFAAEGVQHSAQRRELTAAFKYRHLKELYPTFWEKTTEVLEALSDELGGSSKIVDVDDWAARGTLDAIGLAAFAYDFRSVADPETDLVRQYRKAFMPGNSGGRVRKLALIIPIRVLFRLPMKWNRDAEACIAAVRATLHRVVQKRQFEAVAGDDRHSDLLNVILRSRQFTATDVIVSQCMTFLAAGHEAPALALGWTLFELSKNPDWQQRLRNEIRANVPSPAADGTIDAARIDELPLLEAVVKESLRFWAPVPRSTRVSSRATIVAGRRIPAGRLLILSSYSMNRATRNWGSNAGIWNPERWLGSSEARSMGGSIDRQAFSTFSHGTCVRSCIGKQFAHSEVLVFLAGLVGRFEWTLEDVPHLAPGTVEADHDSTIVLKVVGGLKLRAKVVRGW